MIDRQFLFTFSSLKGFPSSLTVPNDMCSYSLAGKSKYSKDENNCSKCNFCLYLQYKGFYRTRNYLIYRER